MLSAAKEVASRARSWPPLTLQLLYFMGFSVVGFVVLKLSKPRTSALDLFFTSVSATTVSSMSTLDMEVFSNPQLLLLTLLMLVGGDVFISTLSLRISLYAPRLNDHKPDSVQLPTCTGNSSISNSTNINTNPNTNTSGSSTVLAVDDDHGEDEIKLINARRCLYSLLLAYLLLLQLAGSLSLFLYVSLVDTARDVLRSKGISLLTFSIFTTVSSFANCGFVPTNENMLVFRKNPGLLLLLLPQLFLGTTLFPFSLRFFLSTLARFTKRPHFAYVLNHPKEMGFSPHLLSAHRCRLLAATVFGFVFLQLVLFCSLEWDSDSMEGMTPYEKFVGALFQVVNSRHAGESVVDLSTLSPATLVLFILMMYLPAYTTYIPVMEEKDKEEKVGALKKMMVSQLSFLSLIVLLVCITERHKLSHDPLNFNVLNITLEVISAYGNVGFSTAYSCQRRLQTTTSCQDASYGFAGRWSPAGKFLLIIVMFFGRLKQFSANAGSAWNLYPSY